MVDARSEVGVPLERLAEKGGPGAEATVGAEHDSFAPVLAETVRVLEAASVPFTLIGGIAVTSYGRPRWTHDIDVFVRPEDAEETLCILAARGYTTERPDPRWLFKAFKHDVMIDVIFRCTGGFYLDDEILARTRRMEFQGCDVPLIPPEDLLLMKAAVHDEIGPRHWHDALGILGRTELDWDYLLSRARKAPRRLLSLLIYAHSIDLSVPNRVVRTLFEQIYGA
jgi:predicted nucleotidyltransferase